MQDFQHLQNYTRSISDYWGEPDLREDANLIDKNDKSLLAELCRQISKTVQFPLSTTYAHAIGCIAAAMNRSFYVNIEGSINPVNLYIVSAQPPSTGKSGVNGFLSDPIEKAYWQLNKNNAPKRAKLTKKIKNLSKEISDDEKSGTQNEDEVIDKVTMLMELNEEIEKIPSFQPFFTNATPEALESHAFKQQGIFNIVSDEAGSILSTLGITYGVDGKPANADMVLQGWDKNRMATIRVSRDASNGRPRGVFSVLAQDETIEAILTQGDRGVGIAERFLLCREPSLLGARDHTKKNIIDDSLLARYAELVNRLVLCDELTITASKEAAKFINEQRNLIEPEMGDYGKYSSVVLRGVLGKVDKQTYKIASILHASENWEKGIVNKVISLKTMKKAFNIFMELTKVYISTSDEKGFGGVESQVDAMVCYLQKQASKGKMRIKTRTLLDNTKKTSAWKGQPKQTSHFRATIMPILTKRNICKYHDEVSDILINPKIV